MFFPSFECSVGGRPPVSRQLESQARAGVAGGQPGRSNSVLGVESSGERIYGSQSRLRFTTERKGILQRGMSIFRFSD